MESDEINIVAFTMLGDLEQVDQPEESRLSCQLWSDLLKTDWLYRVHLDLAFFHSVTRTNSDVLTRPDSDAARDFSTSNPLT